MMKIGDKVFSTKVRPDDVATIVDSKVYIRHNEKKNKDETRTEYIAKYDDGSILPFYGFNIGKSIFKFVEPDGQMTLDDFMNEPIC